MFCGAKKKKKKNPILVFWYGSECMNAKTKNIKCSIFQENCFVMWFWTRISLSGMLSDHCVTCWLWLSAHTNTRADNHNCSFSFNLKKNLYLQGHTADHIRAAHVGIHRVAFLPGVVVRPQITGHSRHIALWGDRKHRTAVSVDFTCRSYTSGRNLVIEYKKEKDLR